MIISRLSEEIPKPEGGKLPVPAQTEVSVAVTKTVEVKNSTSPCSETIDAPTTDRSVAGVIAFSLAVLFRSHNDFGSFLETMRTRWDLIAAIVTSDARWLSKDRMRCIFRLRHTTRERAKSSEREEHTGKQGLHLLC